MGFSQSHILSMIKVWSIEWLQERINVSIFKIIQALFGCKIVFFVFVSKSSSSLQLVSERIQDLRVLA